MGSIPISSFMKCFWPNCKEEIENLRMYCQWHYLCKECIYALYDLDPKKDWKNTDPKDIEFFKKWAVERLQNLAKFAIENSLHVIKLGKRLMKCQRCGETFTELELNGFRHVVKMPDGTFIYYHHKCVNDILKEDIIRKREIDSLKSS